MKYRPKLSPFAGRAVIVNEAAQRIDFQAQQTPNVERLLRRVNQRLAVQHDERRLGTPEDAPGDPPSR